MSPYIIYDNIYCERRKYDNNLTKYAYFMFLDD